MFLDDIVGEETNLDSINMAKIVDDVSRDSISVLMDNVQAISADRETVEVHLSGLQALPDPKLLAAGRGIEKLPSKRNDKWALKRADILRKGLG